MKKVATVIFMSTMLLLSGCSSISTENYVNKQLKVIDTNGCDGQDSFYEFSGCHNVKVKDKNGNRGGVHVAQYVSEGDILISQCLPSENVVKCSSGAYVN